MIKLLYDFAWSDLEKFEAEHRHDMTLQLTHLKIVFPIKFFGSSSVKMHKLYKANYVTSSSLKCRPPHLSVIVLIKLCCHIESSLANKYHVPTNLLSITAYVRVSNINCLLHCIVRQLKVPSSLKHKVNQCLALLNQIFHMILSFDFLFLRIFIKFLDKKVMSF